MREGTGEAGDVSGRIEIHGDTVSTGKADGDGISKACAEMHVELATSICSPPMQYLSQKQQKIKLPSKHWQSIPKFKNKNANSPEILFCQKIVL